MTFRTTLTIHRSAIALTDMASGLVAWWLGGRLRFGVSGVPWESQFGAGSAWVVGLYILVVFVVLQGLGAYRVDRLQSPGADLWLIVKAMVLLTLVGYAAVAMLKLHGASRLLLGLVLLSQGVLLALSRLVVMFIFSAWCQARVAPRHLLLLGPDQTVARVTEWLRSHPELGWAVTVGPPRDIRRTLREQVVDEVILVDQLPEATLQDVVEACASEGKPVHILLDHVLFAGLRARSLHTVVSSFHGLPMLSLTSPVHRSASALGKRLVDFLLALTGVVVLLPLLVIIGLLVKLTSPGPVFFTQDRVGLNGRLFRVLKFRTMVQDAERLKESLEHLNEAEGPLFKIRDDPRITPVGKWLRRLNLDELPQLINVLKGDMSLVGPRPLVIEEARQCAEWHKRHSVRPGLTGPWQVNPDRHSLSIEEAMALDLSYIEDWSLLKDLELIFRTIPAVLGMKGL